MIRTVDGEKHEVTTDRAEAWWLSCSQHTWGLWEGHMHGVTERGVLLVGVPGWIGPRWWLRRLARGWCERHGFELLDGPRFPPLGPMPQVHMPPARS